MTVFEKVDYPEVVERTLRELSISPAIKGYDYLAFGIVLAFKDASYQSAICSRFYPHIAQRFNTTTSRVERAMRHAIEVCYQDAPVDVLQKYFGNIAISSKRACATNSTFIYTLAYALRNQLQEHFSSK